MGVWLFHGFFKWRHLDDQLKWRRSSYQCDEPTGSHHDQHVRCRWQTMQLLGVNWVLCAVIGITPELAELGQAASSGGVVGNRPDRIEPRANKRRPKALDLLAIPRAEYHARLQAVDGM